MERRPDRTDRSDRPSQGRTGTVVDAKMSLALWLRAGRAQRGMSLEAVAKVTKIQGRILERLEAGKLDGLPADVFVRGFVRSFARCVGLDEAEAVRRYGACVPGATLSPAAPPTARAMVEAMADLAPRTAAPRILKFDDAVASVEEIEQLAEPELAAGSLSDVPVLVPVFATPLPEISADEIVEAPVETTIVVAEGVKAAFAEAFTPETDISPSKGGAKKRKRGGKNRGGKRKALATGTPSAPTPILVEEIAPVEAAPVEAIEIDTPTPVLEPVLDAPIEVVDAEPVPVTAPWLPTMPPVAPSVPWRRPAFLSSAAAAAAVPSLVIDDADPDSAERVLEERAGAAHKERRSFLPPILLDREDRSARQGGLTLAVIILLVAATLTLSYLMRRPSAAGDGMTRLESQPAQLHA